MITFFFDYRCVLLELSGEGFPRSGFNFQSVKIQ